VGCSARPSGIGSSHGTSGEGTADGVSPGEAGPKSIGMARRLRLCSMSSDTLVAIR
jgi:hypothetical protein